jgi:hypothetical protein
MNTTRWIPFALALASLVDGAVAQDAASTLGVLLGRAEATVHARFLGATFEETHRSARFTTVQTVAGDPTAQHFTLTEPDGRACGRALTGLVPGATYVAFLATDPEDDHPRLVSTGSRALALATPGLLTHVRALASAPSGDWTAILAGALSNIDPRVRTDAALDLARRADLETAPTVIGTSILHALTQGLQDESAPHSALIQAALRSRPAGSSAVLVQQFVDARMPWLDRCLLDALARCPAQEVAACLPAHSLRGSRAAQIATRIDPAAGMPILAGIAAGSIDPIARATAAATLLQRGIEVEQLRWMGVRAEDLHSATEVPPRRPRFRSINPMLAAPGAPR